MAKQKINVIIDMPDPEYTQQLMAEALVDIVANRIEDYPPEQQIKIYDELIDSIKEGEIND